MAYQQFQQQDYSQQGYPQQGFPQQQPGYPQEQQHHSMPQQHAFPPQSGHPRPQAQPTPGYPAQPAAHHQTPQGAGQYHAAPVEGSDAGKYGGIQYIVKHRNTNSMLEVVLPAGEILKGETGAMIHMEPSVQIQGKSKFSMRKYFTGDDTRETLFTGPGRVALAPTLMGDIIGLKIDPGSQWKAGMDGFLASTSGVEKIGKSQGFRKAWSSGEDMFVYNLSGEGMLWLTTYGAVEPLHLAPGQEHIVDNGHLVAWNCEYKMERAGGGYMQGAKTGEGHVCRFTGPGVVYIQTRNLGEFSEWVQAQVSSR